MDESLSVFMNRAAIGDLSFNGMDDRYDFSYNQSWLDNDGFYISPHIVPGGNDSDTVKRFLSNLLPEGRWLEELSVNNQVSKSNIFGLINILGEETSGALTFHGNDDISHETSFRPVSENELRDRINERGSRSIAVWDGKQRLSIAGMQEKLPVIIQPDGTYGFGEGELASTHIMKFSSHPDTQMVINEYLCMKLAEQAGVPAAGVSLRYFDEPVLLVERFDRMRNGERVERLHIIDGCQLLDLPPTYKYERPFGSSGHGGDIRTGVSLPKLFNATDLCRVPAKARMGLLQWSLFQLLIGNCDAHGKNISFFITKKGTDLAPAYDMLNINIYKGRFDQEMAMAVGDEFILENILPYQLAEFSEECGHKQRFVSQVLGRLCDAVLRGLDDMEIPEIRKSHEKDFAKELLSDIRTRTLLFKEMAEDLPGIVL